jgi:hypothetical protein
MHRQFELHPREHHTTSKLWRGVQVYHGQHFQPVAKHTVQWISDTWIRKSLGQEKRMSSNGRTDDIKLPTVLLVLGNTNEEIVRISSRFPILAFFLSITNINKRPNAHKYTRRHQPNGPSVFLGPYGSVANATPTNSKPSTSHLDYVGIVLAHVFAGIGVAVVIYQTVDLGRKAVMSWGCWTDWYLIIWVWNGAYHHIASVICMRLSLRVQILYPNSASHASTPTSRSSIPAQSAILVWDLTRQPYTVVVAHKRFARWSKAAVDLLNNVNYMYGTAVFSSLTLVSGNNAIQNLAKFGAMAVVGRVVGFWVLEQMGGLD